MLFELSTAELALVIAAAVLGATALGTFAGQRVRHLSESFGEPLGVLQAAFLGVVGLLLAFGLSLSLSRYEDRRATIVTEANAIGTTYLRAQMLDEPVRTRSLALLRRYTASAIEVADEQPGSAEAQASAAEESRYQQQLWTLAGQAVAAAPNATAPRLYVETLNEMIDAQTSRIAALANRVPSAVLILELLGACLAVGFLAGHLALIGRSAGTVFLASALVAFLLFITVDLDRPTRGPIQVPDTVLVEQLRSMQGPPAASPATPGREVP
ncbi:DUF4239 domain-containing protein [Thermoleophilia bacterium SCSIO 60948]|nr:DUF4239 domain-containing protein [Thermoleophilia bacterium SCSIO 60948]